MKELFYEPVYNYQFLKTKRRSYGEKAPDSHEKEVPKVCSNCNHLAVILIDSAQMF